MPIPRQDSAAGDEAGTVRAQLLAAACDEFCEVPFYEADTDRIAERAGLSPGTFYSHFRDKAEIFAEALMYLYRREAEEIIERVKAASVAEANAGETADIIVEFLLASRRRQALIRLQCAILHHVDPRILDAERRAQSHYVTELTRALRQCPAIKTAPEDHALNVYILNSLINAIANEEFEERYRSRVVAGIRSILSAYFGDG